MRSNPVIDNSWEIIEEFTDPKNEDLLNALINGANALRIEFTEPLNETETKALFEGIHVNLISLYLQGNEASVRLVEKLTNKIQSPEVYNFNNKNLHTELLDFLSLAKDYLAIAARESRPLVSFTVDDNYLGNIAKLRSIRILWNHLLESFGIEGPPLKIIATTSEFNSSTQIEEDFIHSTIQLMSSIIASADAVLIKSPNKTAKSESFKARISRNLHHLAEQEGRMGMVRDPLKGSYYIEEKSNEYAREAWNKFTA